MYVYALTNHKNRIYVGMTSNLNQRLEEHNSGHVFSTKGYRPWQVLYFEQCKDRQEARRKELYYKSGVGKENLKKLLPR